MMRARGIVLAGIAAAGVLGASVQAGTVLEESDDSALGWWSEGAGDEGIGSAPMPVAISDTGDRAWRRGSLYGGIKRPPHGWAGEPRPGWGREAGVFPGGGVLSGEGSMAAAGCLTIYAPSDAGGASIEVLGTDTGLWLGGTVTEAGYSMVLAGGDITYAGGSLVFSGGGAIWSTVPGVFDLTSGGNFTPGVISDGSLWTVGQDGTLMLAGGALSPVPEPGSLALAGLGFFLIVRLVRKARRSVAIAGGNEGELTCSAGVYVWLRGYYVIVRNLLKISQLYRCFRLDGGGAGVGGWGCPRGASAPATARDESMLLGGMEAPGPDA